MITSYSRSALLELRLSPKQTPIATNVFHKIKHLGICNTQSTHRGNRAGKKQRQISVANTSTNTTPEACIPQKQNLDLCFINAQSVCNKVDALVDYVMDEDMDCVALTETWLSDSGKHEQTIANLTISGYVLDHAPRVDRTGGGPTENMAKLPGVMGENKCLTHCTKSMYIFH